MELEQLIIYSKRVFKYLQRSNFERLLAVISKDTSLFWLTFEVEIRTTALGWIFCQSWKNVKKKILVQKSVYSAKHLWAFLKKKKKTNKRLIMHSTKSVKSFKFKFSIETWIHKDTLIQLDLDWN